ncbi:MAG: drug/metabolite transporter (DMT)-like permease [Oceanicoccus sp.]|jgi:drug/metabolite transporter (DMT)-like permease
MQQPTNNMIGYIAGFLAISCWSGFVLVSRLGGQGVLMPVDTVALRFMIGCLLLLPLAYFYRPWFNLKGFVLALTGGLGYCFFVYAGFQHTTAVHAAVLLPGLIPFLSALFAVLFIAEKITGLRAIGLALIGAGAGLMLTEPSANASVLGDMLIVLSVVCWALYTVLAKRWKISPWQATTTVAYGSLVIFLPIYFSFFESKLSLAPWSELLLQGFYQGFIAVIVAMVFYMVAVEKIGPSKMGAMMAFVPVISGLAAVALLSEPLTFHGVIALCLTSLGALFAAGILSLRSRVAVLLTAEK